MVDRYAYKPLKHPDCLIFEQEKLRIKLLKRMYKQIYEVFKTS